MNEINNSLLFKALEQLATTLGALKTPEDIRHDYETVDLMVEVNQTAHEAGSHLIGDLEKYSPSFVQLYSDVMLRSIREPVQNGIEED